MLHKPGLNSLRVQLMIQVSASLEIVRCHQDTLKYQQPQLVSLFGPKLTVFALENILNKY